MTQERKIDHEVLQALGITELKSYQSSLHQIKEIGRNKYMILRDSIKPLYGSFRYHDFEIHFSKVPDVSAVPDTIWDAWGKIKISHTRSRWDNETLENMVKTFLKGFGEQAFQLNDLETAINSSDVITEGGVLNDPYTMERLRETVFQLRHSEKPERGLEIANMIQTRIDKRITLPSTSS